MVLRSVLVLALVTAVACSPDPDGDGLNNREERELQLNPDDPDSDGDGLVDGDEVLVHETDPLDADSDDDGLADGAEIENGADPHVVDTDGDGYTDRDEVAEGSDPADAESVIYQGGWPYYFDKDEIGGGNGSVIEVGRRFRRIELRDQFGDRVDLFDLYDAGKPVMVDVSGLWCGWCHVLADWLDYVDGSYPASYDGGERLRDAVRDGDAIWITVVSQGNSVGSDATRQDAMAWFEQHPHERVMVLTDPTQEVPTYMQMTGWPNVVYLSPELRVIHNDSYTTAMALASQDLEDGVFNGQTD